MIIDEIMADPAPSVGLPGNEWIELKNTTATVINLLNWRIGDASGQSGALPVFLLQPDSFVVVCAGSALAAMHALGPAIAVSSFPSLDNADDQLYIKAPGGGIIHALAYSSSWYQNDLKKEGGWSLEMIDTGNPCEGRANWRPSLHSVGGTPGAKNSVDGITGSHSPPRIMRAYAPDSISILLVFDGSLDSSSAAILGNYHIDGNLVLAGCRPIAPLWNEVELKTTNPLLANTLYTLSTHGLIDCSGHTMEDSGIRIGLPAMAVAGDLVINEILFDPRPNGSDFVELYNNGDKILDAGRLYIANRGSNGTISSIEGLSAVPAYIFPGEYIVLTGDAASLSLNYLVKDEAAVFAVPSLPSFPDDAGDVIVLNSQGAIVDEVNYNKDWHFKLIHNAEGVSLERIDPGSPSQAAANWHSAASTAGYGTPGYRNSQAWDVQGIAATIAVSPPVFSPDNDGFNDMAAITYAIDEAGYVANLRIFDANGGLVRQLVKNDILSRNGHWTWDGLDDKGQRLAIGIYMIFTEIFNLEGRKERFKNVVVLGRN